MTESVHDRILYFPFQIADNAVWTYENPIDAVAQIKDCLSFYVKKLDVSEEVPSEG